MRRTWSPEQKEQAAKRMRAVWRAKRRAKRLQPGSARQAKPRAQREQAVPPGFATLIHDAHLNAEIAERYVQLSVGGRRALKLALR